MSDEFKPCPFCGGEASLTRAGEEWDAVVVCEKCGATISRDSDSDAIDAWNDRGARTAEPPERTCRMMHVLLFDEYAVEGIECDECGWEDVHGWDEPMPERCPGCRSKVVG